MVAIYQAWRAPRGYLRVRRGRGHRSLPKHRCLGAAVFTYSGSTAQEVKYSAKGQWPGAVAAYVTNNSNSFAEIAAELSNGVVSVSIPAKGVVTLEFA
jgi:hypothetical protein